MVKPVCSKCGGLIAAEDINIGADMAYCRVCNEVGRLSDLTGGRLLPEANLQHPPAGAWYRQDGAGTVIGARHWSPVAGLGLLVFAVIWNGIIRRFYGIALAALLKFMCLPIPAWLPSRNLGAAGSGQALFSFVFSLLPIGFGIFSTVAAVFALFGHTEVRIQNGSGVVYNGVGRLGFRRRFDAKTVRQVDIDCCTGGRGGRTYFIIIKLRAEYSL